jgi:hypothetical protein
MSLLEVGDKGEGVMVIPLKLIDKEKGHGG